MSHSVVVVTGPDVEAQLEPFDENLQVEPYKVRLSLDEAAQAFAFVHGIATEPIETYVTRHRSSLFRPDAAGLAATERAVRESHAKQVDLAARLDSGDRAVQLAAQLEAIGEYHGEGAGLDDEGYFRWSTYNPRSRWDWYVVGGRWRGFWTLTEEAAARQRAGDRAFALGEPGTFEKIAIDDGKGPFAEYSGKADSALKRDIDFRAMRQLAELEADRQFDAFEAATEGLDLKEFRPWSFWMSQVEAKTLGVERAREVYHAQPAKRALWETRAHGREVGPEHIDLSWSNVEDFLVGRAAYVKAAGDASFVPFAVLHQGEWIERGQMGWFGMARDEREQGDWNAEIVRLFEMLPEDTLLTAVDVHI